MSSPKISPKNIVSLAAATAVLASGALAGVASAATFGTPVVEGPGTAIPINFAVLKEPADNKLPKNYRIVKVHVDIKHGEQATTVLRAPKGFRNVTIGLGDGQQIGAVVKDTHYSGKRSVGLKVWANDRVVKTGQTGHGTLYLLAKRG